MVQDNSEEYMPGVSFPDNHTRVPKEKKFLVYLFCILGCSETLKFLVYLLVPQEKETPGVSVL